MPTDSDDSSSQVTTGRKVNWRRGVWRVWFVLWLGLLGWQTTVAFGDLIDDEWHETPANACRDLEPDRAAWIADRREWWVEKLASESSIRRLAREHARTRGKVVAAGPDDAPAEYEELVASRASICKHFLTLHLIRYALVLIVPWATLYLLWYAVGPGIRWFYRWLRDGFVGE